MRAGWSSLLPLRLLPGGWDRAALGRPRRFAAAVLIADVRGFTAMSEAVGGPEGTERLSDAINALFTPIVASVHAHGGEVALFVGDAVVAVFPDGGEALACAADVHGGEFALSVGLAAGDLTSTVVGDPDVRLEHVLGGAALARAAAAQRRAPPGETVAEALDVHGPPLRAATVSRALAAPFAHPSVAARIDAGRDHLLAEHRRVTALFCHFAGDPQTVVLAALDVLANHGGALLQVEAVDKGPTLKATFGAPVAHEDDERRAAACARALLARDEFAGAAIGLSTGNVYCGLIGSPARREYTVLGDAVNVAARLMLAAAPGQVLEASAGGRALELRGRKALIVVREPPPEAPVRTPGGALVGRERELVLCRAALARGGVVTIVGEPGIGKSRLLEAVLAGTDSLRGTASDRGDVYAAWRQADPALLEEPPGLDALDPERRAEALHQLVAERLRERAPLVLAFEDCQWLDEPSLALLEHAARVLAGQRVTFVLTARPGARLPPATTIALGGLSPSAIAQLVDGDVETIVARAGGNPLFAQELDRFARLPSAGPVPDSLRGVISARLDALAEPERAVVRVASVIGERFDRAWLAGADPALGDVSAALATLAAAEIVQGDAFKHALFREVAYDTLALAARAHLHQAVALHLERAQPDALEALAHHYGHTRDTGKQRVYWRRAGDAARAAFANAAAIGHYRALAALDDALDVRLDLGAVLQLAGEWAQAAAVYAAVRADSEHDAARVRAAQGGLLASTGAYPEAVAHLEAARCTFTACADRAALAGVLERLAHTYFEQGDDERALARAGEHVALARDLGDRAGESTALNTLGLVLWHRGELEPARAQLEAALAIAESAGHRVGVTHLRNDLAGVLAALGRPAEAIARLGEAYAEAHAIGYRRFEGLVVGNAAELFHLAGDGPTALACAERSLTIGAALGDGLQVIHNATVIAAVLGDQPALLHAVIAAARAADNRRYLAEALLHLARATDDDDPAREALEVASAVGQADLAAAAREQIAGTPPRPPEPVSLDAAPFLVGAPETSTPAELVRRAQTALLHLK